MLRTNLTPWTKLTRNGVPEFIVARRPLTVGGREFEVGAQVDKGLFVNRVRMRQMYEQRLIVPLHAPRGSVQAGQVQQQVRAVPVASSLVAPVVVVSQVPVLEAGLQVAESNDTENLAQPQTYHPKNNFFKRNKNKRR